MYYRFFEALNSQLAHLKLGSIAHLKKQLTSIYFLRPSLSTIVSPRFGARPSADLDALELTQLLL